MPKANSDSKHGAKNKLFFLHCDTRPTHNDMMWHVGSAICPSLAIHIITTCCSDSWIVSVMRSRGGGDGGGGGGAFKLISPLLI